MYIKVRVVAKAKHEEVRQVKDNELAITVKQPAERNLANARVIELVARFYTVPVNKVMIINGHHTPTKLLVIRE